MSFGEKLKETTDKVDTKKFVVGNYQYKKGYQIV